MTVEILPNAREDILQIHAYLERESPAAADAQLLMALDSIDRLADFPYMRRTSSRDADLREFVVSPFVILYSVDADAVRVLQ